MLEGVLKAYRGRRNRLRSCLVSILGMLEGVLKAKRSYLRILWSWVSILGMLEGVLKVAGPRYPRV